MDQKQAICATHFNNSVCDVVLHACIVCHHMMEFVFKILVITTYQLVNRVLDQFVDQMLVVSVDNFGQHQPKFGYIIRGWKFPH